MPRPKKIIEKDVSSASEEIAETISEVVIEDVKPPTQILVPFHIQKTLDNEDIQERSAAEENNVILENNEIELQKNKFEIYSNGEYVETVEEGSSELLAYLDSNRKELDKRIEELWQNPSDPNDLIFFNFGEQKMIYKTYNSYFSLNGFAPVEPKIKSWMEYYLRKHNPITEEEIVIQLKGPLQYSFIPIKS
jgi:hypothetical protein